MTDTRQKATKVKCKHDESITKQDTVVAYIWAWLYYAYVKFVMCMRDMWVVQWYCIFEGLVEICWITKMMGVVCEVLAGFLQGFGFTGCW